MKKFREFIKNREVYFMKARLKILGVLLAVAVLMSGCGASSKYESAASAPMAMDMVTEEAMAEEAIEMEAPAATVATNGEVAETPQVGRKLIRTFDINIETNTMTHICSDGLIFPSIPELFIIVKNNIIIPMNFCPSCAPCINDIAQHPYI